MIQSAQRKMLRLIIQTKRRYKKIVKHKVKTRENLNSNIDSSCTDDESEDDAAEIEEEDWVYYTKRSTNEAMEKIGKIKRQDAGTCLKK